MKQNLIIKEEDEINLSMSRILKKESNQKDEAANQNNIKYMNNNIMSKGLENGLPAEYYSKLMSDSEILNSGGHLKLVGNESMSKLPDVIF